MIIYPSNIDQNLSKGGGRKVPRKFAVDSPKPKEILKALGILGVSDAVFEKDFSYPRRWWNKEGRIVIEKEGGKRRLLREISREIRKMRASS